MRLELSKEKRLKLVSVYTVKSAPEILYDLLKSRDPKENISHREMPSWGEHNKFIASTPYTVWFLIELSESCYIGTIYLTRNNEIGVHLFSEYQGKGYGAQAITRLMAFMGSRRYLANISPRNARSAKTFEKLGFTHIQNTYELKT